MKRLSDYKGEDAIELWAELLEPLTEIFGDDEVQNVVRSNASMLKKATVILARHKKEAVDVLTTIDPTPVNGLNIITRLINLINEFQNSEEIGGFLSSSRQEKQENTSSGVVTENTAADEK